MSPVSSYRNSSESDHDVNDKVDGEGNDDLLAGQPWYDPSCDHRKLELKPKLRFTCPTQFKEAVQTYSVSVGANIKWPRSNQQKVVNIKWTSFKKSSTLEMVQDGRSSQTNRR
ncbi:hypothetical protein LINPERHAP2_LOCUS15643 [Linum perenne]